jgi:predicted transcriptional regulator of viral defense system
MKLTEFVKKYNKDQVIDSSTFSLLGEDPQNIRCQVRYWRRQGHLILLKRGVYVLNNDLRKQPLSLGFVSNFLLSPSYISLEYALSYYDLIPEAVMVYTSVSTKKTTKFKTPLGVFEYRSVKDGLFFGFTKVSEQGQSYFIAYPEKALLDFFYFHQDMDGSQGQFDAYRFQNLESLNLRRLNEFRRRYNKKTNDIARAFIGFIKSAKKGNKTLR